MQAIFGLDNCCSNAIVSLLSSDGKLVKVNKYFLFLHNDFYKNLLVDLNSDDVTIVFDDVSFCDLLVFQKSVHEKHFKCINTAEDIEQQNTSRTDTGTRSEKKSDSDEQLNIGVDNNEGIEESNEKVENSEKGCGIHSSLYPTSPASSIPRISLLSDFENFNNFIALCRIR